MIYYYYKLWKFNIFLFYLILIQNDIFLEKTSQLSIIMYLRFDTYLNKYSITKLKLYLIVDLNRYYFITLKSSYLILFFLFIVHCFAKIKIISCLSLAYFYLRIFDQFIYFLIVFSYCFAYFLI